jgi:hypothetical protein
MLYAALSPAAVTRLHPEAAATRGSGKGNDPQGVLVAYHRTTRLAIRRVASVPSVNWRAATPGRRGGAQAASPKCQLDDLEHNIMVLAFGSEA